MVDCCSGSKINPDKDPRKYLKSHLMVTRLEGTTLVYSQTEKKNNSGIMSNQRYLLLHGHSYIGYFNTLEETLQLPFRSLLEVPILKMQVPLQNVKSWSVQQKTLTIKYVLDAGRKQEKEWEFKFDTVQLANDWRDNLKRAEMNRNDQGKKALEHKTKSKSINNVQEQLKNERNRISLQQAKNTETIPLLTSMPVVQYPNETVVKVQSQIVRVNSSEVKPQEVRIIDRTNPHTPNSNRKPALSPQQTKQASVKQHQYSPIEQIRAKSPSFNSSLRESPPKSPSAQAPPDLSKTKQLSKPPLDYTVRDTKSPQPKEPTLLKHSWAYRIQKENIPQVLHQFRQVSAKLAQKVVNNLFIGDSELKLRRVSQFELLGSQGDLNILICFNGTRQNNEESQTQLGIEFRNFEHMFCSTEGRMEPLVPLTSLSTFKGILVYITCQVGTTTDATLPATLSQRLTEATRITKQWNQNEITRSQDHNKLFCVRNLNYLPSLDGVQLTRNFIHLNNFQSQKFTTDLQQIPRTDKRVEYIRRTREDCLKASAAKLDEFAFSIVGSHDFQQFLQMQGINPLQLGQLYNCSRNQFVRRLIGYECVLRVSKGILFRQMQMSLSSVPEAGMIADCNILLLNNNKTLLQIIVNHLNAMIGKSKNSAVIWEIIERELGERYNLHKPDLVLTDAYLVQGMAYHFNVEVDWRRFVGKKRFDVEWDKSMITRIRSCTRVFSCDFHLEFKAIRKLLETKSEESYKALMQSLDLFKLPIPERFRLTSLYQDIKAFVSLYMGPEQEQERCPHLQLYQSVGLQPASKASITLQISTLKWALKKHNRDKSIQIFDQLTSKIDKWLGPCHPYLTQIYNLQSSYYQSVEEFNQAITLAKSSIINDMKMFGSDSIQVADAYCFLADIYTITNKYDEALIYEKKAKNIYSSLNVMNSEYIQLLVRVSRLNLHFGRIDEALEDLTICIDYFEDHDQGDKGVTAYDTAARCYQVTKHTTQYKVLAARVSNKLTHILDPLSLQKLVKISIFHTLKELSQASKEAIKQMLGELPRGITQQAYTDGYHHIRGCLKQQRLDTYVETTFRKIETLNYQHVTGGREGNKRSQNQNARTLALALRNFLGPSFVSRLLD